MSILLAAQKRQQAQGQDETQVYADEDSSEMAMQNRTKLGYASVLVAASVAFALVTWGLSTNKQPENTQQVSAQPIVQKKLPVKDVEHTVLLGDINLAKSQKQTEKVAEETSRVEQVEQTEQVQQVISAAPSQEIDKRIRPIENAQAQALDIDPKLLAKFNAAVAQTMSEEQNTDGELVIPQATAETKPLVNYPESFQASIPELDFQTHIYSSEAKQRWVKVNGKIVKEEQEVATGLVVKEIKPQQVILAYKGKNFSLPALTSWRF
ncbi:general secretion pathway protein GspB [Catenovulum sp. SX2]|uniref:general secretion pathway protein GspB n=1 Tax=Catenovulum sp. SX2 TaxID=3398614 RepID=UPI003F839F27